MKVHRAAHSIATLCRVLEVSPSGYYAWYRRTASQRAHEDASLTAEIEAIHRHSRGTYGAPRIHPELVARGRRVSRKRVARLMRAAHLRGVSRRKFVVTTTQRSTVGRRIGREYRFRPTLEVMDPDVRTPSIAHFHGHPRAVG